MSDIPETFTVANREEVSTSGNRRKLISALADSFKVLDPARISAKAVAPIVEGLPTTGKLCVIGFGKASLGMYRGVREHTAGKAAYSGLIIPVGEKVEGDFPELDLLRGNHPIPGKETLNSSRKLLNSIGKLSPEDVIIVLVSGGGSAIFEIPRDGLTINDIGEIAKCLMASGADIRELNIVRHAMSLVKGGRLAEILKPATVYAMVISDVPGDDLQLIASGPLTRPSYGAEELPKILDKYGKSCGSVSKIAKSGMSGLPGPDSFLKVHEEIILKNSDFVREISKSLGTSGEEVVIIEEPVAGDVEDVSRRLAQIIRAKYDEKGIPVWLVAGGETTATVKGKGIGGRNCELSVRFSAKMDLYEEFTFASIGTDGIDGVSPAMGGITDTAFRNAVDADEIRASLDNSDTYNLLKKYHSAIMTGYTGTNVSDIFIVHYSGRRTKS